MSRLFLFFFFNDTATTEIYTLSLHDALPISGGRRDSVAEAGGRRAALRSAAVPPREPGADLREERPGAGRGGGVRARAGENAGLCSRDRGIATLAGKGELTEGGVAHASAAPTRRRRVSQRAGTASRPGPGGPG